MNINTILLEHDVLVKGLSSYTQTLEHLLNAPLSECDYQRLNKGIEQAITETEERIFYLGNQAEKLTL